MSELTRLIERLRRGIARSAPYVKTIRHPELLVISLQELNDLIGNDKIKDSVATQVSHLIMMKRRSLDDTRIKEDDVMLNTVLYGPPGTGKTLVGTKLAKIWYSLGYLDGSRNTKERKQEIGDLLKDLFKDGNGTGASSSTDDNALVIYVVLIFAVVFVTILSLSWSFYNKFGAMWTFILLAIVLFVIFGAGYYLSSLLSTESNSSSTINKSSIDRANASNNNPTNSTKNTNNETPPRSNKNKDKTKRNTPVIQVPPDDQIIKVVTRADFVDRYVGWTSIKTVKLLEENLGKVLFVDEAYSLINGPHDEFGMEAVTALNLFLSQRPKEIIVIFAGYKDLLQTGVYSVQPGLKRRFMWQFSCSGYTSEQLFEIFKMQLNKKGWGMNNEDECRSIFNQNMHMFPAFGGDTERLAFFSELEHSRDFIGNDKNMAINMLEPEHIQRGLIVLEENNIREDDGESSNPIANMMRMISSKNNNDNNAMLNSVMERAMENNYR